jgi:hypothetical protein
MSRKPRLVKALGVMTGIAVVAGVLAAWFLYSGRKDQSAAAPAAVAQISWGRTPVDTDGLAARSGVRITQVAVTGGGGLLDLRFQVLDPNRANSLHDAATPPAVIDESSGLVVRDLLMSHAHTGKFTAGETYYLVFENPGNWIRRGSKVTVLLGQAQVAHVVVR